MSFKIVIPARHGSSRLPGKPLADIGGKPMVVRVAERAARSGASGVWVATDHAEIQAAVERHGFSAVMTRIDHTSGTDRIAEVADRLGWDDDQIVVNLQGDEPLIDPDLANRIAAELQRDSTAAVATACHALAAADEFFNPDVVKVVCDARGYALYFSRAPIPFARDAFARGVTILRDPVHGRDALPEGFVAKRHVGTYAYRCAFLRRFGDLSPSPLERFEMLEQLRVLWHGFPIRVLEIDGMPAPGVDTADDLERVRARFDAGNDSG